MKRKYIPATEVFAEWRTNPKYVAAYDALEEEFALASALIGVRNPSIHMESLELRNKGKSCD